MCTWLYECHHLVPLIRRWEVCFLIAGYIPSLRTWILGIPRLNVSAFPPIFSPSFQFTDLSNPLVSLKLCGDPRPYPPFVSISNNVVINFHSDEQFVGSGFSFYPNFNNCPVFAFIPEPYGRVRFASSGKDYSHKVLPSRPLQSQIFLFWLHIQEVSRCSNCSYLQNYCLLTCNSFFCSFCLSLYAFIQRSFAFLWIRSKILCGNNVNSVPPGIFFLIPKVSKFAHPGGGLYMTCKSWTKLQLL